MRIDERETILIPPHPALDAFCSQQDQIKQAVADYYARKRRRTAFRQIARTIYWAAVAAVVLLYVLRMIGAY